MKQTRYGKAGELTFEIFQTWCRRGDAELILMDFLKSDYEELNFVIPSIDQVLVSRINKSSAQRLLDERHE